MLTQVIYNIIIKWLFVVVATYLRNHWIKLHIWPLGGKKGSLRFYLTGFGFDPTPLGSSIEGKQKGLLAATGSNTASLCAISHKNWWVLKILPVSFL